MASKNVQQFSAVELKTDEREFRLAKGTRKHIRRLKLEGRLKEAVAARNEAKAKQNGTQPKPVEKLVEKKEDAPDDKK